MLIVSSAITERCGAGLNFRANSIKRLPKLGMVGILQERRKRIFDFLLASFLLVFLAPVLILIAIAIKLTSEGPVLFQQRRYGRFKIQFTIFKFRTMSVMESGDNFTQARKHDPRITKLGAFLRRTSLDELPQLWNVVRGDMSLVGPRPHAIAMDDDYARKIFGYNRRFLMKPGITGLAQCKGFRGNTEKMQQMIGRLCRDIYYVRNRSMSFDIRILAMTVVSLLTHDAY
ncbi:MAG: sugar transferase [Hyphomicrobiales bacterium]